MCIRDRPYTGGPLSYIDTIGVDAYVATADMLAQRHGARFTPPQLLRDMAKKGETFYKDSTPSAEKDLHKKRPKPDARSRSRKNRQCHGHRSQC